MLRLPVELLEEIYRHVEATYPEEGCGFLVGKWEEEENVMVHQVLPVSNTRVDSRHNRYLISPEVFLQVNREVEKQSLEIVGFYHSHPDAPAKPSDFDREYAWFGYVYMIVPAHRGKSGMPQVWKLTEDRSSFLPESLILLERRDMVWQR